MRLIHRVTDSLRSVSALLGSASRGHDGTVQQTYDALKPAVPVDATVYADHIEAGPNPRGELAGVSHVPDVLVKSRTANSLIIEIETATSLSRNRLTARRQVAGLRKRGYRRVLIVPPGDRGLEAVQRFCEAFQSRDGPLYFSTPSAVTDLL